MSVLAVLTSLSQSHIRSLIREDVERSAVERGIVQAVRDYGCSVDDVSAATGWTPSDIRTALAKPVSADDLADLTGDR